MESQSNYIDRKRREVVLLKSSSVTSLHRVIQKLNLLDYKTDLIGIQSLKQSSLVKAPESNWTDVEEFTILDHKFKFSYQRFDQQVFAPSIYPRLNNRKDSQTFYTKSGMSSISAFLIAMSRALNSTVDFFSVTDAYFECLHFVKNYIDRANLLVFDNYSSLQEGIRVASAPAVIHFDSISKSTLNFSTLANNNTVKLVIFDTTCLLRTDKILTDLTEYFNRKGVPVVLIRSHLKLDCLGTEVSKVGSIVISQPEKIDDKVSRFLWTIGRLIPDVIKLCGMAPSLEDFLCTKNQEELLKLCALRGKITKINCEFMSERFSKSLNRKYEIKKFPHGMFFGIHNENWTDDIKVKNIIKSMISNKSNTLNIFHSTSFGFDFVAISDVWDVESGKFSMRVSISDEPRAIVEEICDYVIDFLNTV